MIPPRKKKNSAKVNLVISLSFHSIIILALFFFAAREGMLGKKLRTIAVTMAPKEKPPEKPKAKEPERQPEVAKETAKVVEAPKIAAPAVRTAPAPPPSSIAPVAAPPAVVLPSFNFSDGAKIVQTSSDPIVLYKSLVERTLRSRWMRPEHIPDDAYAAEVEVAIDASGKLVGHEWKRGSGDSRWDGSVKQAITGTKSIGRAPPKGFPEKFLVRFDVQPDSEPILQSAFQ